MTSNTHAPLATARATHVAGLMSCALVALMVLVSRSRLPPSIGLTIGLLLAMANVAVVASSFMALRRASPWIRWSIASTALLLLALLLIPLLTIQSGAVVVLSQWSGQVVSIEQGR